MSLLTIITTIDTKISQKLHTLTQPLIPTTVLHILELTGDGRLWFPLSLSLLLSPLSLHAPPLFLSLLAGLTTDILAVGLLKHLVRRPRPHYNLHPMGAHLPVDRWSFPSGHSSRVFFIAAIFGLEFETGQWWFVVGVWIWAVVTAVSRVLLGRHYVVDVVAGSVVGVVNALAVHHYFDS